MGVISNPEERSQLHNNQATNHQILKPEHADFVPLIDEGTKSKKLPSTTAPLEKIQNL